MYRTLFYVNIYGSYELLKTVQFFLAHPVFMCRQKSLGIIAHFAYYWYLTVYVQEMYYIQSKVMWLISSIQHYLQW